MSIAVAVLVVKGFSTPSENLLMTTNAEEETNPPEMLEIVWTGWLSVAGVPLQRSWVQIPLQSKFSDFDYP